MTEFSFVAPILPGKTDAWRKAVAEMTGPRKAAYEESRRQAGISREQVCLQSTPMGDFVVVHMVAPDQGVMGRMMASTHEFDVWFRDAVLVGVHGFDPHGHPAPVEVVADFKV